MGAKFSKQEEVLDLGDEVTKTSSSKSTDGKAKSIMSTTNHEKSDKEMTAVGGSSREIEEHKVLLNNLSILLVDDSITVVKTMKWDLERRGHYVAHARNGKIALDILIREQEFFDAVLMDIEMPIMGGLEALWLLRQWEKASMKGSRPIRRRNFVVCMSTTNVGCTLDMDAFLLKPFPMTAFVDLIKSHYGIEAEALEGDNLLMVGAGLDIDGRMDLEGRTALMPPQLEQQASSDSSNPISSGAPASRVDIVPSRRVNSMENLFHADKTAFKTLNIPQASLSSSVPPAPSSRAFVHMASSKSGAVLGSAKMALVFVIGNPSSKRDLKKIIPLSPSSV